MSSRPPKKINELPTTNSASNSDYLVINQGNNHTKKISLGDLGFDPNFKYVLEDALIEIEENTISAANSAVTAEIFAIQSANSAASSLTQYNNAKAEADRAQLSADTAFVNANVYANTSAGLAATTNGQQFQVADTIESIRYVNNSGVAVEVARYPISNPAVNSKAGKINAWPDPFFRHIQIGKDFAGRSRFWGNSLAVLSMVPGTVFDGNALQRNISGTANMNGPIIYLDDIGAAPGDTVTLRILATGNGTAMLCAARPRNGNSTIDTQKSFLSDSGSNQPISSAIPTRMTCTFVIPANTTNIIIYPYSTATNPVINIEAFWAYKGTPSQGPNWPSFGDDEYQNALINSFNQVNYINLDRLRKFKGKASRRMYSTPEPIRIIMTVGGDSWSTNSDYLIGPLAKKLKAKLGNGGVGWFGMGATGSAQSQVAGDAENIYYATRTGTWTSNYHEGSTSPNISDSRSSVAGSIYQIRNISGVSRPALSDVKLHYTGTSDGVIRWRWNGGAWSANTNVQGSGQQAISLTGFPTIELIKAGANTDNLEIEVVSGSVILCGVDFQSNVPGIVIHKLGSSGSRASHWSDSLASGEWKAGYALLGDVDIHTHLLGVNDDVGNISPSTFKDQMNTITTNVLDAVPGVGVLLMTPPKMPTRAGNDYASSIRKLANEKSVAFIDLQKVFGIDTAEYAFGSVVPMVRSDNAHPTAEYGTPSLVAEIEEKLIWSVGNEQEEDTTDSDVLYSILTTRKNLADPSLIVPGKYYSAGSSKVNSDINWRSFGILKLEANTTYTVSGIQFPMTCYAGPDANENTARVSVGVVNANGVLTFTATAPNLYLWVNMTNQGQNTTTYDSTIQIEKGALTPYSPFERIVEADKVEGLNSKLEFDDVLENWSYNKIDYSKVNFAKRYSTGTKTIINADVNLIAMSDWIPVKEGEFYAVAGTGFYNVNAPQGGFFSGYGLTSAIANITWASPPSGAGKIFQVPEGLGITHAVVSLATNAGHTALAGDVQMEEGEVATAWRAYNSVERVQPDLVPNSGGGGGGSVTLDDASWFKYVEGEAQPHNLDKWPQFRKHMLLKDKDVCIVSTGTSLTARSTEHHSEHLNAKYRPPLMHSNNLASHIWDKLIWQGQKYARYDANNFVTENSGTWATSYNLAEWDDGAYRNGLTRYSSTASSSVTFTVPQGTWAWRFIYRTDSVASTNIAVSVQGGNGLMQVYDESTSSWIEANGYSFSQRESAPVTRSVSIPNPDTGVFSSSTISTKSNTTYQKRLKFRCVDRSSARTITFTNSDGTTRFNYWGAEWSPRQYMVTYINAARGSHNTQATSATGLPRFADNEVHGFNPDLIYMELPIHNDGAAGAGVYSTWDRWGRLTDNYIYRNDYELSLLNRASSVYGYTPEIGMWTPSIAYNFNGISETGELIFSTMGDGVAMTALDKFDQAANWVADNHPESVFVHSVRRWVEAGFAIYGDLKTATVASGTTGPTMTNDGSHPNDVGDAILGKLVAGPLCFETL